MITELPRRRIRASPFAVALATVFWLFISGLGVGVWWFGRHRGFW